MSFMVPNLPQAISQMRATGVTIRKSFDEGLPGPALVYDPDGYLVRVVEKYKKPVYRGPGVTAFDGEWTERPPQKIRGLLSGLQGMYRTMH